MMEFLYCCINPHTKEKQNEVNVEEIKKLDNNCLNFKNDNQTLKKENE